MNNNIHFVVITDFFEGVGGGPGRGVECYISFTISPNLVEQPHNMTKNIDFDFISVFQTYRVYQVFSLSVIDRNRYE